MEFLFGQVAGVEFGGQFVGGTPVHSVKGQDFARLSTAFREPCV
jgi:hypothetical protein